MTPDVVQQIQALQQQLSWMQQQMQRAMMPAIDWRVVAGIAGAVLAGIGAYMVLKRRR